MVAEPIVVFLRDTAIACWCRFAHVARIAVAALREDFAPAGYAGGRRSPLSQAK